MLHQAAPNHHEQAYFTELVPHVPVVLSGKLAAPIHRSLFIFF